MGLQGDVSFVHRRSQQGDMAAVTPGGPVVRIALKDVPFTVAIS